MRRETAPTPNLRPLPNFWERIKSIDAFFAGRDEVHRTMKRLLRRLERAKIPYVVAGGMAVYLHGYRRTTDDVDVLVTREGLAEFRRRYVPRYYRANPNRERRLIDRADDVIIDFLVTGLFPGSGKPGPIAFPDPEKVVEVLNKTRVLDLATLIQLKLAARRHQDFADVVALIRARNLDEAFLERLDRSVHRDFIECLDEKRREDQYEARED